MSNKGKVSKQRQLIDKLLHAFEEAQLDLVRPYELLQEEFKRQHVERQNARRKAVFEDLSRREAV